MRSRGRRSSSRLRHALVRVLATGGLVLAAWILGAVLGSASASAGDTDGTTSSGSGSTSVTAPEEKPEKPAEDKPAAPTATEPEEEEPAASTFAATSAEPKAKPKPKPKSTAPEDRPQSGGLLGLVGNAVGGLLGGLVDTVGGVLDPAPSGPAPDGPGLGDILPGVGSPPAASKPDSSGGTVTIAVPELIPGSEAQRAAAAAAAAAAAEQAAAALPDVPAAIAPAQPRATQSTAATWQRPTPVPAQEADDPSTVRAGLPGGGGSGGGPRSVPLSGAVAPTCAASAGHDPGGNRQLLAVLANEITVTQLRLIGTSRDHAAAGVGTDAALPSTFPD
ncbi:hypothetical protein [Amycolatopsis suaedae]|uniref:Uncharacterized protein n=1 Tax=Amycolatopsis suaedae TaxID=2510978 RepID=A0A4Q7JAP6_9PSEU|nr:hypothetical protein [Amycolatopsis suaedae]RZQ64337.1 hypothetical protein EWH70_10220 [Amycolatopsis suaedae]